MMQLKGLTGSIVALVTPFHADGSVNFEKLGELIEFQITNGSDGILVLGTTGESPTMTHEEDLLVCQYAVDKVAGRVPVIAGSGSNCTTTMLEKSRSFEAIGVDGLLLIAPYYNKANNEGMYRHFATVADVVKIPAIIYNVPGRTGCSIPVSVVERLAQHPNIIGIKEASGDISYAVKIAHCVGPDFSLWSGNDDITLPILALGGSGIISVWANIQPKECHWMVFDWLTGNEARAKETCLRHLRLMNDLFIEVNPIPVKTALNMMGKEVGPFRLPLCDMGEDTAATLRASLQEAGVL